MNLTTYTRFQQLCSVFDIDKLKRYLEGENSEKQLAHFKIDQLLKYYLSCLESEGKDAIIAQEWLQGILESYQKEYSTVHIVLQKMTERLEEYVKLLAELKEPTMKMKAMKELQLRNLL